MKYKPKKKKPNIRMKISLQILSIMYLLFLITHQIHSPTTAYFTDSNKVQGTVDVAENFVGVESDRDESEEKKQESDHDQDEKYKENTNPELADDQNEQQKSKKNESSGTEMKNEETEDETVSSGEEDYNGPKILDTKKGDVKVGI